VEAMKYLRSVKVIHRDLKLGNLFLNEKMEVKVGDFGLASKVIFEGEKKRTICGTPNYIAPEVLSSKTGHSYEVDLWSLGVITYTMIFGRPPFETRDVKVTYRKIKSNNYTFPQHVKVEESTKNFIKSLLKTDPLKRLDLDQIMEHEFFSNYPTLMPASTLSCPPSAAFMERFAWGPDHAPKPGCSPTKIPVVCDEGPLEGELIDNDDAQIISNRQASVQSHRRIESQEKFAKIRGKDAVSNERDYMLRTERAWFKKSIAKGLESSPYWSPKHQPNYLQINLAKMDDEEVKIEEEIKVGNCKISHQNERIVTEPWIDLGDDLIEQSKPALEKQKSSTNSNIKIEKASSKGPEIVNKILVSKWIDYSSKYGLGYQLSNGAFGVLFNDSTKLILSKDNFQFIYLKRESGNKHDENEDNPVYNFNEYPEILKKKVILTQHFISYLMNKKFQVSEQTPQELEKGFWFNSKTVLVKKFSRENKATLLRLNNKVIQVAFLDKSELLLSSDSGQVDFITSKNEVRSTTISSDMKNFSSLERTDPSLFKRLNYAKEMLLNLINPKQLKKNKAKKSMFPTTHTITKSKENEIGFSRKNSEMSGGTIEFYVSQQVSQKSPNGTFNLTIGIDKYSKIDQVVRGAAEEIRKKLANYHTNENDKPEFRKSESHKASVQKGKLDTKWSSRSPNSYAVFTKSNHNFNSSTSRVLSSRLKTSARYQYAWTTHNRGNCSKNKAGSRGGSKTGRNSVQKEYQSMGREETSSGNYFTGVAFMNTINLNAQKQNVKINLVN
jgi:serine/threonine protein kinase